MACIPPGVAFVIGRKTGPADTNTVVITPKPTAHGIGRFPIVQYATQLGPNYHLLYLVANAKPYEDALVLYAFECLGQYHRKAAVVIVGGIPGSFRSKKVFLCFGLRFQVGYETYGSPRMGAVSEGSTDNGSCEQDRFQGISLVYCCTGLVQVNNNRQQELHVGAEMAGGGRRGE